MQEPQWIFVAEITMAVDSDGTLQKHYACTDVGFTTLPGDAPPHTAIPPTLTDPGTLRREMFGADRPFGGVKPALGVVVLDNTSKRYSGWGAHGFDGRPFVLRRGPLGGAFPADFPIVYACNAETGWHEGNEFRLTLTDATKLLDRSVMKDTFIGGSVAEGGDQLMGQAKVRYIGAPRWCGPAPTHLSDAWGKTIYHVSTGRDVVARAWDNGNELQQANVLGDFWSYATGPASGTFWLHYEDGNLYLRVGSRVVGDLRLYLSTCQTDGAPWSMQALLAETGFDGEIVGTPIPGINAVVADTGVTYSRLFDDAANNAGLWYGIDRLGRFVVKPFDVPSGPPVLQLHRGNCMAVKRAPVQGMAVPLFQLSVNSMQTWKSGYTAPYNYVRHMFEADQWLARLNYSDNTVLKKHPGARRLNMDMLIGPYTGHEWADFCDRYLRLFGVQRASYTVSLMLTSALLAVDLGDVVRLSWNDFDLSAGRLFRIIGIRYELKARRIDLVLWG